MTSSVIPRGDTQPVVGEQETRRSTRRVLPMTRKIDERYGVPPLRQETFERVLLAGGREKLTLGQLEKRCLARLTRLVADTTIWPSDGYRQSWRIGDFNILIVETTVAPKAELYVQFWSEPNGPVDWEVSSGNWNPGARKYITKGGRAKLGQMGFEIGGRAGNFRKQASIANGGDAAAIARETLRIFHDALGYRGATPLVARVTRAERCDRAVVHHRFSETDTATLLQQLGYDTKVIRKGKRPILGGRQGDFRFMVVLDAPSQHRGEFHCLDFVTSVGDITDGSHAAWGEALNRLNSLSRVARGWIDTQGNVCVGASLNGTGGLTEDAIANTIYGWQRAAAELRGGPPKQRTKKRKKDSEADDGLVAEDDDTPRARPVVH